MTLNCIVCRKTLEPGTPFEDNQPADGIEFFTYGHYGTTVFDPMNGDKLAINVCDPCLIEAQERGDVLLYGTTTKLWERET